MFTHNTYSQLKRWDIGIRFNRPISLSTKYFITNKSAVEVWGGYYKYRNINYTNLAIFYEYYFKIKPVKNFYFNIGIGYQIFYTKFDKGYRNGIFDVDTKHFYSLLLGFEYRFKFLPISINLDAIPSLIYVRTIYTFDNGHGALSIGYRF
ncbi:MAG: hypothetical protein ABI851_01955 [Saprospiraceae bacterium]